MLVFVQAMNDVREKGACAKQFVKIPHKDAGLSLVVAVILGVARSQKRLVERRQKRGTGDGDDTFIKRYRNLRSSVDRSSERGLIWCEARDLCVRLDISTPVTLSALPLLERHFSAHITVFTMRDDTPVYPCSVSLSIRDILMGRWRLQNGATHRVVVYHTPTQTDVHHYDYV